MDILKKMKYKYLQNSYKPGKSGLLSKKSTQLIDDIEKALDKNISKLFGDDKDKSDS